MIASSGESALKTSDDTAIVLIAATKVYQLRQVRIVNEGSVSGFYSYDGGIVWHRLPARTTIEDTDVSVKNLDVQAKRVSGGPNLTGLYCSVSY